MESLPPEMVTSGFVPFISYLVFVSVRGGLGSAAKARPQGNRASQAAEALISHGVCFTALRKRCLFFRYPVDFSPSSIKRFFLQLWLLAFILF